MKILHTVEYNEHRIIGKVKDIEVITIETHLNRAPTIMGSVCLPPNIQEAEEYIDCMKKAINTLKGIVNK